VSCNTSACPLRSQGTRFPVANSTGNWSQDIVCKNGAFVTSVSGKADTLVNLFGAKCSDGTVLPSVGYGRGTAFQSVSCDKGIRSFSGKSGSGIDQIGNMVCTDGTTKTQKFGGDGGGVGTFGCLPTMKMVGYRGNISDDGYWLTAIQPICQ
jgi:hypothetical protein